jgi:predicted DNA-binding transcriptional regulator AlpA
MKDREVDLNDEVWGIGHIAQYMGQSEKSMYKLVAEPGFPMPLHSQSRNRRWLAEEVRKFLFARSTRTLVAKNTNVSHMSDYQIAEPKNFSFKKTKEAVR